MKPTHYTCPRCRDEGLDHDCGNPPPEDRPYELQAQISVHIPLDGVTAPLPGSSGTEAAIEVWGRLMDNPDELTRIITQAIQDNQFYIATVQPVYLAPPEVM